MMWMVALLLRVVLVNSIRACFCHRVLCFKLCEDGDEEAAAEAPEVPCCQMLVSSLPRQVLPA